MNVYFNKKIIKRKIASFVEKDMEVTYRRLMDQWLTEKQIILITYETAMLCLHKIDFDPIGEHSNPYLMDLMYVKICDRRKGYITHMLANCCDYDITCFSWFDIPKYILLKNNFVEYEEKMFRRSKKGFRRYKKNMS